MVYINSCRCTQIHLQRQKVLVHTHIEETDRQTDQSDTLVLLLVVVSFGELEAPVGSESFIPL